MVILTCLWITQLQNQTQNESYNKLIYIMSNKSSVNFFL